MIKTKPETKPAIDPKKMVQEIENTELEGVIGGMGEEGGEGGEGGGLEAYPRRMSAEF